VKYQTPNTLKPVRSSAILKIRLPGGGLLGLGCCVFLLYRVFRSFPGQEDRPFGSLPHEAHCLFLMRDGSVVRLDSSVHQLSIYQTVGMDNRGNWQNSLF
jgi:hypothetical protein